MGEWFVIVKIGVVSMDVVEVKIERSGPLAPFTIGPISANDDDDGAAGEQVGLSLFGFFVVVRAWGRTSNESLAIACLGFAFPLLHLFVAVPLRVK
ncbi:hypothetical protein KFK09_015508 [Dendrobium nobile]|uniref:Uncharacterized protein n=1 Tax=Dendrobium nobile TaxID=94219 RepID=A0A8T3BAQ2_DENNO|nr:hypothetical protein KFK09_015508 [Dendrobium nobile]